MTMLCGISVGLSPVEGPPEILEALAVEQEPVMSKLRAAIASSHDPEPSFAKGIETVSAWNEAKFMSGRAVDCVVWKLKFQSLAIGIADTEEVLLAAPHPAKIHKRAQIQRNFFIGESL